MTGKRDAIGATARLVSGGETQIRSVISARSYLSSSDPRVHFGLGEDAKVDLLEVTWPDGSRERFEVDTVDKELVLRQASGDAI